ncbi:MAG: PEP-CTERM sorting domain-containing protein [Akkermansiaceae bacterium]|jgi:hypothetical protein
MDTLNQIYILIRTFVSSLTVKTLSKIDVMFFGSGILLTRLSLGGFAFLLFVSHAQAATLSWGSMLPSILRDSNGNALNSSFQMQLGFFVSSFIPNATNTADWASNWRVFDQAGYYGVGDPSNSFDPLNGYYSRESIAIDLTGQSQSIYADIQINFTGKDAYLWVYNSKTAGSSTTEWLLVRSASWVFPVGHDLASCCSDTPVQWSVSDLGSATPIWGAQGSQLGGGAYTGYISGNTLQTFTFIPEPSTALLTAIGTAFVLLLRRRQSVSTGSLNIVMIVCVVAFSISTPCKAERIHWYGPTFKTNLTSTGDLIDESMVFELGLFKDNFIPTSENIAEWSTHWLVAQRANYSPNGKFFTGKFVVDQQNSPFTGGKPAYIWGFRGGVESGEWILFRKDTWNWPVLAADQAAEARNPLSALEWNAAEATAIVGNIKASSQPFLMKTARVDNVVSPKTSWEQWAQIHLNGENLNRATEDSDGDGVSNLLEYVFGSSPKKVNKPAVMSMNRIKVGADEFMELTIPRRSDHTANLTVEVSSDLINWRSGPTVTTTVSDNSAGWVVRDLVPDGADQPKRFYRLKVDEPNP